MSEGRILGGLLFGAIATVGLGAALLSSAYVIDEGRVGVITYMGQAVEQEKPNGLQFKTPFVAGVREFDVRERALPLQLAGATSNQLATTMDITINWRPDPDQIMRIFVEYGGPEEFAANVIRPRLAQSAKSVIGKYSSVALTRERNAVANAIYEAAVDTLSAYPALISSAQIENFTLPDRYWNAVLDREEQREVTEKEALFLEQQALQAQRDVQTAEAARDAEIARADGAAYATRTEAAADAEAIILRGEAEASAIKAQALALGANPLFVELRRVEAWNGTLPVTVMGDQPELMMQMPK